MAKQATTKQAALTGLTRPELELGPFSLSPRGPKDALELTHWRAARDGEDIAWAILDKDKSNTNTLSEDVLSDLDRLLDQLEKKPPLALVIRSAKKNGFIAGAEIGDFKQMKDPAEVAEKIGQGLEVLKRLARFPAPSVALIHGFCLGGGLELALACNYRIAREDASLGFPEVFLGLHPGLAGTWRSLELMTPPNALTLMLSGKTLNGRRAKSQGLIDAVTQERHFAQAVKMIAAGTFKTRRLPGWQKTIWNSMPARALIAAQSRKQTAKRARPEHYPAPYAMIDLWREHGGNAKAMADAETPSFAKLLTGEASRNLVRAFFLRDRLKAYGKKAPRLLSHVHVIGAGAMGGDIAAWCAYSGLKVTVQDRELRYIAPAIERAGQLFKRKRLSPGEIRAAHDRLIPDVPGYGLKQADIVIEAVPENIDIKHTVFKQAEATMRPDAILATNTSTIGLDRLAEGVKNPGRLIGVHFFNPVAAMMLVEIVTHPVLDNAVRNAAFGFVASISKLPLPVKSAPGFLVNRALTPYLLEALACLDEGLAPEAIDGAAEQFGMPMGPVELADRVGLDICLHAARVMAEDLARPLPDIPEWFETKVEAGDLGRKTGRGLYRYEDGKPKKAKLETAPDPGLADRLILPLIDACAACVREGVVDSADTADAGMIFGAGFAPFRGGPLHYAANRGISDVTQTLERLARSYGARFEPDKGWKKLAADAG
jgi:3-hydroxyacyl-CoA dehydrogenase/enoyl-CoA hydratase/3-hydroxybutyryl-CoA epimerase